MRTPDYVRRLIAASAQDTMLTSAFSNGWPDAPHRVLAIGRRGGWRRSGDVVGVVAIAR